MHLFISSPVLPSPHRISTYVKHCVYKSHYVIILLTYLFDYFSPHVLFFWVVGACQFLLIYVLVLNLGSEFLEYMLLFGSAASKDVTCSLNVFFDFANLVQNSGRLVLSFYFNNIITWLHTLILILTILQY